MLVWWPTAKGRADNLKSLTQGPEGPYTQGKRQKGRLADQLSGGRMMDLMSSAALAAGLSLIIIALLLAQKGRHHEAEDHDAEAGAGRREENGQGE